MTELAVRERVDAPREDHEGVAHRGHAGDPRHDRLRRLPLVVVVDAPGQLDQAAGNRHADGARPGQRVGLQRRLGLGEHAAVTQRRPGGVGGSEPIVGEPLAQHRHGPGHARPFGVDDHVVEQRILPVEVIEEPDAGRQVAVGVVDVLARALGSEPLLPLDPLGSHALGGDHADAQRVRHVAEDDGRRSADEHHVVAGRHLEDGRLDVGEVAPLALAKPVPQRRALLGRVTQVHHGLAEGLGRLGDDLPVGELPAEPAGQGATDLRAAASDRLGHGHDAHGPPPG